MSPPTTLFLSWPTSARPWVADGWDFPLGPAEIGQDRNRVVDGDTGPRVPHISHVFGDKEKLLIWAYCWLFGGSGGVPLGGR